MSRKSIPPQLFNHPDPKFLLLGARSPSCLDWARFLSKYGTVYVADSTRFALSFYSNAIKKHFILPPPVQCFDAWQTRLNELIHDNNITAVIPTCEEAFYLSLCQEPNIVSKRWCLSSEMLIGLHDKYRFSVLADKYNFGIKPPATKALTIDNLEDYRYNCQQQVFKPIFSRFASHTLICPTFDALCHAVYKHGGDWIAQDYVAGQEICSFSLIEHGKVIAHTAYISRHRAGKGASVDFVAVHDEIILEFVKAFAKHTHFVGQVGFDFIQSGHQYFVLECNPRATSGIHLLTQNPTALKQAFDVWDYHVYTGSAQLSLAVLANMQSPLSYTFWQNLLTTPDVIFKKNDIKPLFAQIISAGEMTYRAWKKKLPLLASTTVDIEFNGAKQNDISQNSILNTWLMSNISNVSCQKSLYALDEHILPITISNTQPFEHSYVASPINQYGAYAIWESVHYFDKTKQNLIQNTISPLIKSLKSTNLDNIIYINNYLLSTNLYPSCPSEKELQELLFFYQANYPNHAIGFRSLNDEYYGDWCHALKNLGAIKLMSRRIYLLDCRESSGRYYRHKKDFKKDYALLNKYINDNDKLQIIFNPVLSDDDYQDITYLYKLLYLDKYCQYNPKLDKDWIKSNHQSGFIDLVIIRDKMNKKIIAVAGFIEQNDIMTTPLFGYDTALPQKLGLYRLLSMLVIYRAEQKNIKVHLSAGAGEFKRNRGALAYTEYTYVCIRHLPVKMKIMWRILQQISNQFALPIMIKKQV